jgi:GH24 family phage-related lysozyme (muramidase)
MAQWFDVSPAGLALVQRFEGCEKRQPDGTFRAYKHPGDPWTIGWGQTGVMPDGREVEDGLVITQAEADEALAWFVHNVSAPLTRKHFNARTQAEFDALHSWVYNVRHDKLERGEYSLPAFVNLKARDLDALIAKWAQYTNPNTIFEQGLYRRRLAEICMFLGLPWHFALTAILRRSSGMIVDRTDPYFIIDMAEASVPIYSEPDPPKPPAPVIEVKSEPLPEVPPVAPNVDPVAPPKPMEDSKTFKGLSKKESGQETVVIGGTLGGLSMILPHIEALTSFLSKYPATTILSSLGLVGAIVAVVGGWRWFAGRMIAYEGRQQATAAKV